MGPHRKRSGCPGAQWVKSTRETRIYTISVPVEFTTLPLYVKARRDGASIFEHRYLLHPYQNRGMPHGGKLFLDPRYVFHLYPGQYNAVHAEFCGLLQGDGKSKAL